MGFLAFVGSLLTLYVSWDYFSYIFIRTQLKRKDLPKTWIKII